MVGASRTDYPLYYSYIVGVRGPPFSLSGAPHAPCPNPLASIEARLLSRHPREYQMQGERIFLSPAAKTHGIHI